MRGSGSQMFKTHESETLFDRARRVSPGGVHSPVRAFRGVGGVPRFIRSAKGAELEDVDGNRYVDFCMSWGPLLFGHQDEDVAAAVHAAIGRGWSYGTAEPYSLELAELITREIPWVEKIRFVNSGTEAVMSALRLARAATGRNKILKFEGCYHGHADSMLVRAGSGLAEMPVPDSAGVTASTAADTLVAPLRDLPAVKAIFERHGREIAAVIVEPVPANNGLLPQTEEFLKGVASAARASGALLILDEVITGFRVAFGGMAARAGITPDLVTYGKVIGGGFPVGAYGGRADLMDRIAPMGPVYQAGTLSANPVAMAAGLAMLKKLKHGNFYNALENATEGLASEMEKIAAHAGARVKVQRFSSMFWAVMGDVKTDDGVVRAVSEIPSTQKEVYAKSFHRMLGHGIYLAPSGYEVSFLSAAHERRHLDAFLSAFKGALGA
ncbi:MAG: glutamate-1-semialdehyde 2,1-aminomutase [Deltaproteobacteria bacterium]|nr:glutamate-1-semialdehyde 2,1-aminomutase [Deltaproteobacteria bacterium]